jgi:hypothetical protein
MACSVFEKELIAALEELADVEERQRVRTVFVMT